MQPSPKITITSSETSQIEVDAQRPAILAPRASGRVLRTPLTDDHLDSIASILDDFIRVPGTNFHIGLDAFIGMIPIAGDMLSAMCSFVLVIAAWRRGLPKITLLRMLVNIAIDTLIGIIPIVGDCFDAVWKSNRANYRLYVRHKESLDGSLRQRRRDWFFFLILGSLMAALAVTPLLAAWMAVHFLRAYGWL